MKKNHVIVKQLKAIKKLAITNRDKNPEHFDAVILAVNDSLEEIKADALAEIETYEESFDTETLDIVTEMDISA